MKKPLIKLSTIGLAAMMGGLVTSAAIERPVGENSNKEVPAQPQGGILGGDQKIEGLKEEAQAPRKLEAQKVAYLGVGGEAAGAALLSQLELQSGLVLSSIDPESPAGLAGLSEHDIIVALGEDKLTDQDSLRAALAGKKPGDEVAIKLIRRGKEIEQKITLGESRAVRRVGPLALMPNRAVDMNQLLNDQLGNALGGLGGNELQKELMDRLNKAFGDAKGQGFRQLRLDMGDEMFDGEDFKMGFKGLGRVRLEDGQGAIEMKMRNGKREIKIHDREGKLLFEGPYDTEIDKAAVPEEYRDRVERLDGGKGTSFQFKMNGRDLLKKLNEKRGQ